VEFLAGSNVNKPELVIGFLMLTRLTRDGSFKQHLQWSPDGKRLLFTRLFKGKMGLWTCDASGAYLKPLLDPDPRTPHFDGHFSPDGQKIAFVLDILHGTDGKLQINTCKSDGTDSKVLIPNKAFEETPRWRPDGKRLAFVSTRDGNQEIYSADASGGDVRRLTNDNGPDNNPAWSPDGSRLAFASGRSGHFEIYTMKADGSEVRRLTRSTTINSWPVWHPSGKQLVFCSRRTGNYDLWLMDSEGGNLRNLTDHKAQETAPAWHPEGKRLAFVSDRDGGHDIYVMEVKI
jgi:TolB protein